MSPVKVVQEVLSLLQNRAEGKGIQLSLRFATDVPERIRTDPTRLRQILLNLVGNAIKFTEVGGVTVEVACRPDKEEMLFRVQDTGVGMTPEQLAVISRFEPFRQADTRTTRKFGGSGLGLRISNTMANLLGGKIEIDSEYGVGSCFTLSIATGALRDVAFCSANGEDILKCATPVPEETSEQTVQRGAPLDGTRLFLAEDGPDNQRLISYILKRAGAEVSIFDNGKAICDKMSALEPNAWPDLILMDMQMPEMDGYTATRMLLERGVSVPIIALTAHAMSGDRERCLRAGCRDYATKPVDRRLLVDKCAEWIAVGRAETDNRERRAAPPPRSLSH